MDWNWFFSSSAQSAAAIVGIFAAFIITKIVNNQKDFSNKKIQINKFVSDSLHFVDITKTVYFDWYNKQRLKSALENITYDHEEGKYLTPEQYYSKYNFPEFIEKEKVILEIEKKLSSLAEPKRTSPFVGIPDVNQEISITNQLNHEEEKIYNLINDINLHIRNLKDFIANIKNNSESSSLITFSIISIFLLFFIGVIYPLSFLPIATGTSIVISLNAFWDILFSIKGVWLFVVSFIFSVILIVFFAINIKMKYSKSDLESLEYYIDIRSYSPFFEIREKNLGINK